jgi:hypothetical protein
MSMVSIATNAATLRVSQNGPPTADIWILIDGCEFPMLGWNDFAFIILGWWSDALLRLLSKASEKELIYFMDGPYAVEIACIPYEKFMFKALKGPERKTIHAMSEEGIEPFVNGFIFQAQEMITAYAQCGVPSNDVDALKLSLNALKKEMFLVRNRRP